MKGDLALPVLAEGYAWTHTHTQTDYKLSDARMRVVSNQMGRASNTEFANCICCVPCCVCVCVSMCICVSPPCSVARAWQAIHGEIEAKAKEVSTLSLSLHLSVLCALKSYLALSGFTEKESARRMP